MFLLEEHGALLDYSDKTFLETMLRESVNWDQVDQISVHLVGSVLQMDRQALGYAERWSQDPNFWMRRAALLSQLLLFGKGKGDKELFYSFADEMMGEREFFIRKAIGWVLREMSKVDPEEVSSFVSDNAARMSSITLREATRRLPEHMRYRLWGGKNAAQSNSSTQ